MLKGQLPHWDPKKLTIKSTPRVGQAYWIAMVEDATKPEFDGYHPGVIIRACNTLNEATETVSFVPLTSTMPHKMTPYIHEMSSNPNPVDNRPIWAICNHIYTVRLSRLELYYDGKSSHLAPKIETADLDAIFVAIRNGFTAMRTNVETHIKERVKAAMDALEAQFEARVAAAVEAELDLLTSPEQAA
jgi:uncharacterized protein YifN (PemK superfamily)